MDENHKRLVNMDAGKELKSALQDLNSILKSMRFHPREIPNESLSVSLSHPIDNEGRIDADYLVIRTPKDQLEIWCHRSGINVDYYGSKFSKDDSCVNYIKHLVSILK